MLAQPIFCNSVLVVEDDDHIAFLLRFMLEREGYTVMVATDGFKARDFIGSNPPPSLVLLDVMLPYMDGFTLVTLIRENADWKTVPILMLTSKSRENDIVRALSLGANDYIFKPFQPAELMARVKRFAQV